MTIEFATLSILANMYICTSFLLKGSMKILLWIFGFAIILGASIAHYYKII